ncbi:hypothetical protein B0O99DRAFT_694996 [Bisporella sp. PMI_857]|nr:hypothetical protein B0O99DRAFT_694996 [Bisporella sp. PMI_857]
MALDDTLTTQIQWSPPPFQSLNFSSNCSLVADFFRSWFDMDIGPFNTVSNRTDSRYNATFWIPSSLGENATEAYFRNALPPSLKLVPTVGEILDWEYQSRLLYANTIKTFNDSDKTMNLNIPYFNFVIDQPSRFCKNETCRIGVESDQLADLNGPGMSVFLSFQAATLALYSAIVLLEGSHILCCDGSNRRHRAQQQQPKSLLRIIYSSVKDAFDGFSDTIVVFNLALPVALLVHYFAGSRLRLMFRKDLLLAGWFVACSLSSSLWAYRVGACLRRIQKKLSSNSDNDAHYNQRPPRRRTKSTSVSEFLVFASLHLICVFAIFIYFYSRYQGPGFEKYSNTICDFQYTLTESNLRKTLIILVACCAVRVLTPFLVRCLIGQGKERNFNREHQHASHEEKRKFHRSLDRWERNNPIYRCASDTLACLDMVIFAGGTWTLLVFYWRFRNELLTIQNKSWFLDGWSLGQVLAISAVLPILIGFLRCLGRNWKSRNEQY